MGARGIWTGAVTLMLLTAAAAHAVPVDLREQAVTRAEGAAAVVQLGTSVAGAGDVNGDGHDDVVIGSPFVDSNRGFAYVLFGARTPPVLDLATVPATGQGFAISGKDVGQRTGFSVAGAGDVNGDGLADLIVGAPRYSASAKPSSGGAWIVYGSARPGTVDLATLGSDRGYVIEGAAANDEAGTTVAGAGDVNGDGFDDVVVGAPGADADGVDAGRAWVVFGSATSIAVSPTSLPPAAGSGSRGPRPTTRRAQRSAARATSTATDGPT